MNIAILGTGFGKEHAKFFCQENLVDKIIVWGRNPEKLAEIEKEFGVQTTINLDDILNDTSIELVDVCLPTKVHAEYAIKAMRAGKHVFVEMPLADTSENGRKIFEAAKECGRRVFVDLFLQFEYPYQLLNKIKEDKRYGDLINFQIKRQTPHWWGNLDSKNIALNLMHHDIDFVLQLLGKTDKINVEGRDARPECAAVTAQFGYKNAVATIHGNSALFNSCPFSVGFEATFEKAFIRYFEDGYQNGRTDTKFEIFTDEKQEEIKLEQQNCYQLVCHNVLESILENKKSRLDIEHAMFTLETINDWF
ncbi:Predicted dehydrogenase [Treponema bryantii]|uniref:Predicted dehydrogenase n=1 Tax=Treponema bryantii TaxID=163 RepID=A0A1H9DJT9_9SPIR|nr:Gfo/Idh/MocA family oxidoreductase [Treponema bryantii]SEQ12998.1 Predicted dehydrogenase [Treponema bryantii]